MYEWENKLDKAAIGRRIYALRQEIKRISNETLRGNFANNEDRQYWNNKLKSLNAQLSALEQM